MTAETSPAVAWLVLVVPCYNEASRLDISSFVAATDAYPGLSFLFVDDGSVDDTRSILHDAVAEHPSLGTVLGLDHNQGKTEAVRRGVLAAIETEPDFFGYWDADLATPLDEVPRFLEVFATHGEMQIVVGSRINLLGRQVSRRLHRHYLGRVFATFVASGLHLGVYDTQCGAKVFRNCEDTPRLFTEPFFAGWIFDAALISTSGASTSALCDTRATATERTCHEERQGAPSPGGDGCTRVAGHIVQR